MAKSISIIFRVAFIAHIFVNDVYCNTSTLIRMTANGPVEGIEQISFLGQRYYSFRGVPFAAPPITGIDPFTGASVDRRFKAPEPLEYTWTQPLKVHNFSKVCMQQFTTLAYVAVPSDEKSENCLYLNIYVPAGGAPKKTVLVSIHGGAFVQGNSGDNLYGPDFLLSQDNVVVTIQYRLGIFGFLNLGVEPYTGNMGLKDQQLALKWIYKNIVNFSGRNDQILLFGQSSGGAAVHFQLMNPQSRRYFNRAFAQSGAAMSSIFLRKANRLQQAHDCSHANNSTELIEHLKTANASVLAECYALQSPYYFHSVWSPSIESSSVVGAFQTKTPEEIYNSNEAPIMDTMFSMSTAETLGIDANYDNLTDPEAIWKENWKELSLQIPCKGNRKNAFPKGYERELALLKRAYFSGIRSRNAFKQQNLHFMSDFMLGYNIIKSTIFQTRANYNAMGGRKKTFLFRFDVHASLNGVAALSGMKYIGATHGDDLCYMFHCRLLDQSKIYNRVLKSKDLNYDIIMRSVKMITNFARTGDPSIDSNTRLVASKPNKIFHGEVSNAIKTRVKTDIEEQIHYDKWIQAENIYNGLNCYVDYN